LRAGYQFGNGFTIAGDLDLFALEHTVEQPGKLGLRLMDVKSRHAVGLVRIMGEVKTQHYRVMEPLCYLGRAWVTVNPAPSKLKNKTRFAVACRKTQNNPVF
jgi:hypothetical protein